MGNELLASKIVNQEEEPRVRSIPGVTTTDTGFEGVTERGPFGPRLVTGMGEYDALYGGYTPNGFVRQAVEGFFQNGGQRAVINRVVHYDDVTDPSSKTSAAASTVLQTGATGAVGGSVLAANVGPYSLEPGATLVVDTDASSPATATFNAAAAARESGVGTYAISNGQNLTVKIDRGPVQTLAFATGEAANMAAWTVQELANAINAKITGAKASLSSGGTKVSITSDRKGTGSYVEVTGGTANGAIAFGTSEAAGTGNVSDIGAVTVAEIKTVVEAANAEVVVTNVGGAPKITRSGATGTGATVQVQGASTAADEIGFSTAVYAGSTGAAVPTLRIEGSSDGTYAHALKARIAAATSGEAARFNLQVMKNGIIVETWPNLSMDDDDPRYVEAIVNAASGSKLVKAVDLDASTGNAASDRPVNVTSPFLTGGDDGLVDLDDADFVGAEGTYGKTGLRAFDVIQNLPLLTVPGRATAAVHNAMLTYAEITRSMATFCVLDPPANETALSMIDYCENTAAILGLSEFGAIYWPRIQVLNPNKSIFGKAANIVVPPSGHIAGVYARTDGKRQGGVYDPPAGTEVGILNGCIGFETDEVQDERKRDLLQPKHINPLNVFDGVPRHIDGSDCLKGNGNFPTVSERRGMIYIEQSIKAGLQFARHKNNTPELRASCDRTVEAFMLIQCRNGGMMSKDPAKAFFVDFGDDLNTASVQAANQLIGRVGVATAKPIKWIIMSYSQDTRAIEEEIAAATA